MGILSHRFPSCGHHAVVAVGRRHEIKAQDEAGLLLLKHEVARLVWQGIQDVVLNVAALRGADPAAAPVITNPARAVASVSRLFVNVLFP